MLRCPFRSVAELLQQATLVVAPQVDRLEAELREQACDLGVGIAVVAGHELNTPSASDLTGIAGQHLGPGVTECFDHPEVDGPWWSLKRLLFW